MKWTKVKLQQLIKSSNITLTDDSFNTLLERLNKNESNAIFAKRLINYYYKLDNNETGSKITTTSNIPKHKVKGILLSKTPRTIGEKFYEAENLYIKVFEAAKYPETQDRDGNICPEGVLEVGKIIEAQQWLSKKSTDTLFVESDVGKMFTFSGQFQSYKSKVQYNVWDYEASDDTVDDEFYSKYRTDATSLLDDDEAKYQPFAIAMKILTVTIASIWQDGERKEQEFPYFQLNGKSLDNDTVKVNLTYSPSHEGERATYGLDIPPQAFRDIFEEAKDEDHPLVYIQSMLEDLNIVATFTLNQAKPYNDEYVIYGNLTHIVEHVDVDMEQTELGTFFKEDKVLEEKLEQDEPLMDEKTFLSDGSINDVWVFVKDYMEADAKTPLKAELLLKAVQEEGLVHQNLSDILKYFVDTGFLILVNDKYGIASEFAGDKDEKIKSLIDAFVDDSRKNTVAQLAKRSKLHKDVAKQLLSEMVIDGLLIQPTKGRFELAVSKDDSTDSTDSDSSNPDLNKTIIYISSTFGEAFDIKQLVEMAKGHYSSETGNEIAVDDSTLTKLIKNELK